MARIIDLHHAKAVLMPDEIIVQFFGGNTDTIAKWLDDNGLINQLPIRMDVGHAQGDVFTPVKERLPTLEEKLVYWRNQRFGGDKEIKIVAANDRRKRKRA